MDYMKIRFHKNQKYFLYLFTSILGIVFFAHPLMKILAINYTTILYSAPILVIIHKILWNKDLDNGRKSLLILFHLFLLVGISEFDSFVEREKFSLCFGSFREYCSFYSR